MSTLNFLTAPEKRLASNLPASSYTFAVGDLLGWDGNVLTAANFGTIHFVAFRNSASTVLEIMEIDPSTITANSITILKRGLKFTGDQTTEVAANKLFWVKGDTVVSFGTNPPQLYQYLFDYINSIAIAGAPNASTILQGLVQIPTQAQVLSKTAAGSTSAKLAVTPDLLASTLLSDYKADTGTANTYVIAPVPAITVYTVGQQFSFKATNANSGASTLNVNSLGAKTIKKSVGTDLSSGDIAVGQVIYVEYDGTNFQIISNVSPSFSSAALVDQSQTTQNSSSSVGEANATTKRSILAQKFVPTSSSIQGVKLWKAADTGTFIGTVKISLQIDNAGSPSGTDLASVTISNAEWLVIAAAAEFSVAFTTEYAALVAGTNYWVVITPSTSDNSNHPNIGINTAGGYAAGVLKFNNSADGWVLVSTSILYFKTVNGILNKVVSTDGNGELPGIVKSYSLVSADTTSTNTTTVTTAGVDVVLYSKQIEAGSWLPNSGFKIVLDIGGWATQTNGGSPGVTGNFKVKYAGSTLFVIPLFYSVNSNSTVSGRAIFEIWIKNQGSLSSQKIAYRSVSVNGSSTSQPTGSANALPTIATTTASVDTSIFGALEITGNLSNTGSGTGPSGNATYNGSIIEKIG